MEQPMKTISATDAKTHFGKYISTALVEPVTITRTGQETVVMLARTEYERLESIEDAYWSLKAIMAERSGYLGVQHGQKVIDKLLNV